MPHIEAVSNTMSEDGEVTYSVVRVKDYLHVMVDNEVIARCIIGGRENGVAAATDVARALDKAVADGIHIPGGPLDRD